MDIKPSDKTIRDLLGSKRQFAIPRFQREYSWDKKNYQEFFNDMLGNLGVTDGKIVSSQYFLGTMLFIGNFTEGTDQEILVVDGQQRLTTITILFSAIAEQFSNKEETTLRDQIFAYIMTLNDNGEEVRILKSKSHYPYFAYYIQDKSKAIRQEANSEEEICIKDTYEFFSAQLSEDKLKAHLKSKFDIEIVDSLSHTEILKALRDQVLNSTFVSISTTDKQQANRIFEILNAKGKHLAHIDLIKNKIFEVLNKQEPADFAEEKWREIKTTLDKSNDTTGFATFFRHFWNSKYNLTYSNRLYDDFTKCIPKKEDSYVSFLLDLHNNVKTYTKIISPQRSDYDNRKEYFWLVQSLTALTNYFNVVQVRIALLALFDVKERELIDTKLFKKIVIFLENFHFVYNALLSGRANQPEKIYSAFAIALRKAPDKTAARDIIEQKLFNPLNDLMPSFEEFNKKFIQLSFTKKDNPSNVKTKYALNKLNSYFSGKEVFEDDGSIEHIVPENASDNAISIGNLILLEQPINTVADQKEYTEKKSDYSHSNYKWVITFIKNHPDWNYQMISARTEELSRTYYEKILKREISASAN